MGKDYNSLIKNNQSFTEATFQICPETLKNIYFV